MNKTDKSKSKIKLKDLKSFAARYCLEIYKGWEIEELDDFPDSVKKAWNVGKEIHELYAKVQVSDDE